MSDEQERRHAQEVKKLPRSKCRLCGLEGPKPMVHDGKCVNEQLCEMRQRKAEQYKRQREGGT